MAGETNLNAGLKATAEGQGDVSEGACASWPQGEGGSWWRFLGPVGVVKVAVLMALFTWLYWAHLYRLYKYWQEPDWSHGFLILPFSLYIVHTRRRELLAGEHRGSLWGLALIVLSLAVYALSIRYKVGYPQPLSMVSMMAGMVLLLAGWRTLWQALFAIGFLILAIPPPPYVYRGITQPLQQGAAVISALVLNAFPGAEVERGGFNLAYFMADGQAGSFAVAGACSGMRSLMAFVALGLGLAYFTPRPTWQRITMAVVVVPVALFCNVVRVIITGAFQMYGYGNLAVGTPHMILGFAMFGLGFVIYLGILWVLDHLLVEEADEAVAPVGNVS